MAPAAVERDTARPARRGAAGPEVPLPTPSPPALTERARGSRCAYLYLYYVILYLYPQRACHAETTLQRWGGYEVFLVELAKTCSIEKGAETAGIKRDAGLQALQQGRRICRTLGCGAEVADGVR